MSDQSLREQAIHQIKRKREFGMACVGAVILWILMIVIWAISGQGYFWPAWVVLGTLVALGGQALSLWGPRSRPISDADIQAQMSKMKGGS